MKRVLAFTCKNLKMTIFLPIDHNSHLNIKHDLQISRYLGINKSFFIFTLFLAVIVALSIGSIIPQLVILCSLFLSTAFDIFCKTNIIQFLK